MYVLKEITKLNDIGDLVGHGSKQMAMAMCFDKKYKITEEDIKFIRDWIESQGTEVLVDIYYIVDGKLFTEYACQPDKTVIKFGGPSHGNYKKGICKNYKYLVIENSNIADITKLYTSERIHFGLRWVGDIINNEYERVYDVI
jgi:hypothetical protein